VTQEAPDRVVRGYVYFFHSTVTKQTKIGQTRRSPVHRLQQIRNQVPGIDKNQYYCSTSDPRWLERAFHETFADCRAQGEWFDLTADDLTLVMQVPDYVSRPDDLPLEMHLRWIANQTKDVAEDDTVSMNIAPRLARLIWTLSTLGTEDEPEPLDAIVPVLLAECDRRSARLSPDVRAAVRSLVGLPAESVLTGPGNNS